jgi:ABC-type uncharacterized transport system auxiliary subunit
MSLRQHFTSVILAVLHGGCSLLPGAGSPDVYLMPGAPTAAVATPRLAASLRADTPQAGRALDSLRIAVIPKSNVIAAYQGARWSDRALRLLS